ncbi:MAG: Zn-ribbon domain-containing OB-fold protein [Desulfobacteraceae bacterium]|jgi:uncharacterized OB-fold protein
MSKSVKKEDKRFSKFGAVSFTQTTKVNDFIDFLEDGKIMASRCKECSTAFFPPRADCCQCLGSNMHWFEVSGRGELVSYSQLKFAPIGFDKDLPYSIALVDYGDYRVFGRIDRNLAENEIQIGMEMTTAVDRLPEGQLSYVFKKV